MRTLRLLLVGTVVSLMVGVLPLGVAAQTDGDEPPGEAIAVGNLVYATGRSPDEATELRLSVHLPAGSRDAPMVLDAGWAVPDPRALNERGVSVFRMQAPDLWSVLTIDADPMALRTMVEAVACAVRFARESEYGSETAPLAPTGFSRHGGTAAHVALAGESFDRVWGEYHESAGGPPAQWDCTVSEGSTRIDGFVGVAGPYDTVVGYDGRGYDSPFARDWLLEHEPDLWEMLWGTVGLHPELRVRLLHGDADSVIPFESSAAFEAVLVEAGYDVELVEFGGGHGAGGDLVFDAVMELVE